MKLSELKTENEIIDVVHPELGDVGITFTVCSPMSKDFTVRMSQKVRNVKKEDDPLAVWLINQAIAAVVDWSGVNDEDNNPIPFTQEECEKLLEDPSYFWMTSAVDEYLGKKKGYLQKLTNRLKHTQK